MVDDPQDLLRLADEVEKATGPDRGLDARIWCIVGNELGHDDPAHRHRLMRPLQPRICIMGRWLGSALEKYPDDVEGVAHTWRVPALTGSLDAAMTLVPDNLRLMLCEWDADILRPQGPWQAVLCKPGCDPSFEAMYGFRCDHAATPALALCAAALKARAHSTKDTSNVG